MDHDYFNIILLTIDCLRYDYVTPELTPNIWNLAQEGLWYENCYSEYGHTLNSFGTLFKSKWVQRLKIMGYYTAGITYNPYLSMILEKDNPFDFWYDLLTKTKDDHTPFIDDSKELNHIFFKLLNNNIPYPFFAFIHYMDCHAPYYPQKWSNVMRLADCGAPLVKITPKVITQLKAYYQIAVKYIDSNIGNLIEYLKRIKLYDKSIIIISADHGEEFYEHKKFGHDGFRTGEEVLHIPLIVKGKGKGTSKRLLFFKDISTLILNNIT